MEHKKIPESLPIYGMSISQLVDFKEAIKNNFVKIVKGNEVILDYSNYYNLYNELLKYILENYHNSDFIKNVVLTTRRNDPNLINKEGTYGNITLGLVNNCIQILNNPTYTSDQTFLMKDKDGIFYELNETSEQQIGKPLTYLGGLDNDHIVETNKMVSSIDKFILIIEEEEKVLSNLYGEEIFGRKIGLAFSKRIALQLKKTEQNQIIEAYENGHNDGCRYMNNEKQKFEHAENYYNETFKTK